MSNVKITNINEWLNLVANLAVLAGIIFLALEIRQNTQMMQSQIRDNITKNINDSISSIATNDGALERFFEGINGNLDPGSEIGTPASRDWLGFQMLVMNQFRNWENEWYQYQIGLYEETEFTPRSAIWRANFNSEGYRQVWEFRRMTFAEDFRLFVDQLVSDAELSIE